MEKNARIFVYDGKTFKWQHENRKYCLRIAVDECPESPRDWDHLSQMACFHPRYRLGDKLPDGVDEPEKFWQSLVRKHVSREDLVAAVQDGKLSGIRIADSKEGPEYIDVYEEYFFSNVLGDSEPSECLEYAGIRREFLIDYILDDLSIQNCQKLLEPHIEWMSLWLYDHSGITISCQRRYPFTDGWDAGKVGWIVIEKEKVMKETRVYVLDEHGERIKIENRTPSGNVYYTHKTEPVNEENWRRRAVEIMEDEVEEYDTYLRGEVYGYTTYEAEGVDADGNPDWQEIDSCWGFYGDNLLENGIYDSIGCGFEEAIDEGRYEEGEATFRTVRYIDF